MRDDPHPKRPRILRASELIESNKEVIPQILRMDTNETTDYGSHFEYVEPVTILPAFGHADTFGLIYEGTSQIVNEFVGVPENEHPDMHFELFPATVEDHWHIGLFETEWGGHLLLGDLSGRGRTKVDSPLRSTGVRARRVR